MFLDPCGLPGFCGLGPEQGLEQQQPVAKVVPVVVVEVRRLNLWFVIDFRANPDVFIIIWRVNWASRKPLKDVFLLELSPKLKLLSC